MTEKSTSRPKCVIQSDQSDVGKLNKMQSILSSDALPQNRIEWKQQSMSMELEINRNRIYLQAHFINNSCNLLGNLHMQNKNTLTNTRNVGIQSQEEPTQLIRFPSFLEVENSRMSFRFV